ncbi:MAG: N-acetyltransferase [Chitinophagaceae bacterium]|nr:MAG: N-acetyltransferase [Chitinophagaceae bacterium]
MDIDCFFSKYGLPDTPAAGLQSHILFSKEFPRKGYRLEIKPLCLQSDIPIVHRWTTQPYTQKFWQVQCSVEELYNQYLKLLKEGMLNAFIVLLKGLYVAQVDVYPVLKDELAAHYPAQPTDFGLHLLMAPYKNIIRSYPRRLEHLSQDVLITALSFLFSSGSIQRAVAEPDCRNGTANLLAQEVGFRMIKKIQLSYKEANLYEYTKDAFLKRHPVTDAEQYP